MFRILLFSLLISGQVLAGLPPTSTKGNGDSAFVTTFQIDFNNIPLTHSGATATVGTIPLNQGGTGQTTKAAAFDALSPMSASGDIIYGGASGTGTRLAKGTDGQVLALASGVPAWQTAATAVAGSVIQVVSAVYSTATTNSTSTPADTGLTATITPSSASNKILVIVDQAGIYTSTNTTKIDLRLVRNSTDLSVFFIGGYTTSGGETLWGNAGTTYLDSPATTSATTYKTQFRRVSGAATCSVQNDTVNSSITLMEIKQ